MQSSNIDIFDPPHLSENENIIVSASSTNSSALNPILENGQNANDGYSDVFWQKEQNGVLWLDGQSGDFEIFLDEQQRITIMDIHGTKLQPEGATVLKFNDKDIYPGEIEELNKSQTSDEQIEFSDFVTSGSDLSGDQILTSYGVESTVVSKEVTLAHYDSSSIAAKNIHHERLIENDAISSLLEGDTDNPLIENLISGTDLFGADLASIPIDNQSLWHLPLSENVFFDTALVYSSHEFISLRGGKKLYDDSPSDSLIFVDEGPSDLIISEKKADIFLEADSSTSITGANSKINLFQTINSESDVKLSGDFSKLSFNLYQGDATKIPEAWIVDKQLFIDESGSKSIDLSEIHYGSSVIEFNIYNNEGLIDSKSIEYNPSLRDALDIAPAASPEVVGENVEEILFGEREPDLIASEILFEDDVEIVRLDHDSSNQEFDVGLDHSITRHSSEPHFSVEIAQHVEELITEPTQLLEVGQLFADPLDVFDESDFT